MLHSLWHHLIISLSVLAIHTTIGRMVAFPFGIAAGLSIWTTGFLIWLGDIAMSMVIWILMDGALNVKWLNGLKHRIDRTKARIMNHKWGRKAYDYGPLGVFMVSVNPFIGGCWTGTILGHLLNLTRNRTYFLNAVGSALSTAVFGMATIGIFEWIK